MGEKLNGPRVGRFSHFRIGRADYLLKVREGYQREHLSISVKKNEVLDKDYQSPCSMAPIFGLLILSK